MASPAGIAHTSHATWIPRSRESQGVAISIFTAVFMIEPYYILSIACLTVVLPVDGPCLQDSRRLCVCVVPHLEALLEDALRGDATDEDEQRVVFSQPGGSCSA